MRNDSEFFGDLYTRGFNAVGVRLRHQREIAFLLRSHSSLETVVSLGCGDGAFELFLAPHVRHITAIDSSREGIDAARARAQEAKITNVTFICGSAFDLDSAEYDAIIALSFLHHVPESCLPGLLDICRNHLKPGGVFFSQDPNIRAFSRRIGRLVMGDRYDRYHSADEREMSPAETARLFQEIGYSRVTIGYLDVTLIPALFAFHKTPSFLYHFCAAFDSCWCHSPLRQFSGGFTIMAQK